MDYRRIDDLLFLIGTCASTSKLLLEGDNEGIDEEEDVAEEEDTGDKEDANEEEVVVEEQDATEERFEGDTIF